ncbi:uncharacterized protein LOC111087143 [Limulus polyphemus]|uniref:Uncharacterized protein LOC111087143 n=1 Tax=Limulus polyphemus TaxID=6850 RepID=A0ABM1SXV4_LIMPO|nr:uncharacterized protein LOC111087143 [Limulus polyphemus]
MENLTMKFLLITLILLRMVLNIRAIPADYPPVSKADIGYLENVISSLVAATDISCVQRTVCKIALVSSAYGLFGEELQKVLRVNSEDVQSEIVGKYEKAFNDGLSLLPRAEAIESLLKKCEFFYPDCSATEEEIKQLILE